ncbi:MAG: acyl-CoA hydrolase [[Candidatus Thermochlorobacteriaceae] bacterium GBChlB]|nr:MAG: acyl-CoA hydrolase [[Candidatus Thermochlorobacteriaceae] bacterium GBChlB]
MSYSRVEMTQFVSPNDTNYLGNISGGRLMHWMDLAAAIAAGRHAQAVCVTASVDTMEFRQPIKLGEVVIIRANVNRAFTTSMEVGVKVFSEDLVRGLTKECNKAYFTFVAIDENNQPVVVPEIVAETEDDRRRYEKAALRRQIRLLNKG